MDRLPNDLDVQRPGPSVSDYEVAGSSRAKLCGSGSFDRHLPMWISETQVRAVSIDYARSVPQGLKSVGGSQSRRRGHRPTVAGRTSRFATRSPPLDSLHLRIPLSDVEKLALRSVRLQPHAAERKRAPLADRSVGGSRSARDVMRVVLFSVAPHGVQDPRKPSRQCEHRDSLAPPLLHFE